MHNKIEVNEYVRTRAGHIYKITNIDENRLIYWNKIQCGWSEQQLEDIIVKHSKQLIDLIEVGDFVNGMEILHIDDNKLYVEWSIEFEEFTGFLENKDIKTILTKEQYIANCYKVGGEDE